MVPGGTGDPRHTSLHLSKLVHPSFPTRMGNILCGKPPENQIMNFYELSAKDIDGNEKNFKEFQGKVGFYVRSFTPQLLLRVLVLD